MNHNVPTGTGKSADARPGEAELEARWGTPSSLHDPHVLAGFRPRTSDVLITTAPKAGTTWMQQILYQLRTGGSTAFESLDDVVPWLERPRKSKSRQERLAEFEAMPDPRVFKTHCTFEQTPGTNVVRIVLSSRDPRDCCVSFYHHVLDMDDDYRRVVGLARPTSFESYAEHWLSMASWYRNVRSWWPHRNDTNVLWLRYEDMKQDLGRCVDRLSQFLGWSMTREQRRHVLKHSSLDWMRTNASKFTRDPDTRRLVFRPGGFIRRGEVGGYRTLMSADIERRIVDKAKELLEPECLRFLDID